MEYSIAQHSERTILLSVLDDVPFEKLKEIVMEHAVNGVVDLPKEYGMFIARG